MNRLTENYILRALPNNEYESLAPELEEVSLKVEEVINQPYQPIPYVYFPTNSMISVVASTPDGQLSEAGVVGREGVLGIAVMLGADTTPHENTVQLPGAALRITTKSIREKFDQCPVLHKLLLRFTHAHMMQLSQTALCNRLHDIKKRLSRWILMAHDRSDSDVLPLTQELLSIMLGVNRPTVSSAAVELKKAGYIKYNRGIITVLDREGLEDLCCDCYRVVKDEYERMLKNPTG
jgi:CRP-like cAMP-binding protein